MKDTLNGNKIYQFGEFQLAVEPQTVTRGAEEIHLAKRPFDVLRFLIENRERVVSRIELLNKFWDGHDVYDDALRKTVGAIRQTLGDTKKPARFIETRYGSGYRFIGAVNEKDGQESDWKRMDISANLKSRSPALEPSAAQIDNSSLKFKSQTENASFGSELKKRKIFLAIFAVVLITLLTLGFYVYFPKNGELSAAPKNVVEAAAPIRSIAILPLKNLTGDANNEYFSDGVTESIITELSRVGELRVTSRGSTFAFKEKEIDPRQIGKQLTVDALLEGGVQKKGDLLSVSVRLVSASDGRVLWTSETFERNIANAYELQDVIACHIANELRAEICDVVPKSGTANGDAYQAYLKGRYNWNKRTSEGIKRSIEFYDEALRLDKNYALAYSGLAESYVQGIWHVPFAPEEVLPKAKKAGLKALELDNSLAEAHTALAGVYSLEWNWAEAEREIKRAVELNPRYARAFHVQAFAFLIGGRYDEAVAAIERARELDPLNLVINTDKAMILYTANRNQEAFEQWKKTLELDPNFVMAYEHRGTANEVLGNESAAIEDVAKAMELGGKSAEQINDFRRTALKDGLKEIYRRELKDLLAKENRGEPVPLAYIASRYSLLGEKDNAFEYLEKIYAKHSVEIVLVVTDRKFDALHSDPRFADLMKRANLTSDF